MNASSQRTLTTNDLLVVIETWHHLHGFLNDLMQGQLNITLLDRKSIAVLTEFIDHFSDDASVSAHSLAVHELLQRLDQVLEHMTEYFPYLSNEVFPVMTELGSKWAQLAQPMLVPEPAAKTAADKAKADKEDQQRKIRQLSVSEREAGLPTEEVLRRSSVRTQCLRAGLSNSFAKRLVRQNVPIKQIPEQIAAALNKRLQSQ